LGVFDESWLTRLVMPCCSFAKSLALAAPPASSATC